ncbi:MAG: NosD domain-containing protein, partial [Promethearchaeota archaeon]
MGRRAGRTGRAGKSVVFKRIGHVVLFWLVFFTALNVLSMQDNSRQSSKFGNEPRVQASAPFGKIDLNGNGDLIAFANKTGSGTPVDPYVIRDLEIDAGGFDPCIRLTHISLYLIIINCTLTNAAGSEDYAIRMTNCTNVNVTSCDIQNNGNGVLLYTLTTNCYIQDSNISSNTGKGIKVENADGNVIRRNKVQNNGGYGVYITGTSTGNEISLNHISGNGDSQSYVDSTGDSDWYSGTLGNFWGDYESRFPGAINDGVTWNIPYPINGSSRVDEFPLVSSEGVFEPFLIDGNTELDYFCNSSGTDGLSWATAHVIDGLKISAGSGSYGISIKNTDRYLVISNSTITHAVKNIGDAGIVLYSCENINLTRNKLLGNSRGINIQVCDNLTLSDNNISENSYYGNHIDNSNNISIIGDLYGNNGDSGVYMSSVVDSNLTSIRANNNIKNGIVISGGHDNYLNDSAIIENHETGLYISGAGYNVFYNNTFEGNEEVGIDIDQADRNTFLNNSVSSSASAIHIDRTSKCTFKGNELSSAGFTITGTSSVADYNEFVIDTFNLVNGLPVYYYANETNLVPSNFTSPGQIILANCLNATISGISINNSITPVSIFHSDNSSVSSSRFSNNSDSAIYFKYSQFGRVSHSNFTINNNAIFVDGDSHNATIFSNQMEGDSTGVYIRSSESATLYSNTMLGCGVRIEGGVADYSTQNISTDNNVNGKVLYYYSGKDYLDSANFTNAGQIILVNSHFATIENLDLSNCSLGLSLVLSGNTSVNNVNITHNLYGVFLTGSNSKFNVFNSCNISNNDVGLLFLFSSNNNTIDNCTINDNEDIGIEFSYNAHHNNVTSSTVLRNGKGISFEGACSIQVNSSIIGNNISANVGNGIDIAFSDGHLIYNNNISFNGVYGIYLHAGSRDHVIYGNYFALNGESEVFSDEPNIKWDNGTRGNYWDDYSTRYPAATNDGTTWSIPYEINGTTGVYDNHPLYIIRVPFVQFTTNISAYSNHTGLAGVAVQFTFTGNGGDYPSNYVWMIDGHFYFTRDASYTFTIANDYNITLRVTDRHGDTRNTSLIISILSTAGDQDGDGVTNQGEILVYSTNPWNPDTDLDGMDDGWEIGYAGALDPLDDSDRNLDSDGDHLSNIVEYNRGTDPTNADTDGDGFNDDVEIAWFTNPNVKFLNPIMNWIIIPVALIIGFVVVPSLRIKIKKKKKY